MVCGYRILVLAIVAFASIVTGKPQVHFNPADPVEEVITCDCVRRINAEVMPDVNTAINELTSSVDELFKLANATEINPVSVRFFCFFCGRIRRYRTRVHGGHYNRRHYHHQPHHHHHHGHGWGKRSAEGPQGVNIQQGYHHMKRQAANIPVCPIDEVVTAGQTARDGTQLVNEVIASIRAEPSSFSQELLEDIAALYNDVNEAVRNLQTAYDPNSPECLGENGTDVAFPEVG